MRICNRIYEDLGIYSRHTSVRSSAVVSRQVIDYTLPKVQAGFVFVRFHANFRSIRMHFHFHEELDLCFIQCVQKKLDQKMIRKN